MGKPKSKNQSSPTSSQSSTPDKNNSPGGTGQTTTRQDGKTPSSKVHTPSPKTKQQKLVVVDEQGFPPLGREEPEPLTYSQVTTGSPDSNDPDKQKTPNIGGLQVLQDKVDEHLLNEQGKTSTIQHVLYGKIPIRASGWLKIIIIQTIAVNILI